MVLCSKTVYSEDFELIKNAKSGILIEATTGKILYEKNAYEHLPLASMTKIVTLTLIFEALNKEAYSLDTIVEATKDATEMGGSQIYLEEGEKMSVADLLKSVAIASANDAACALAIQTSGSLSAFKDKMNDLVSSLNLSNSHFENPTGLSDENHYSCAYDMAYLARNLITNYPEVLDYTKRYQDYVRENTDKKFWLVNTNKLIRKSEYIDGLKTGWTTDAGYCITATMKKDGMRLISVVFGYDSPDVRNKESLELLNYGMANYEYQAIFEEKVITMINDLSYHPYKFTIVTAKPLGIVRNGVIDIDKLTYESKLDRDAILNLEKVVGNLYVYYDGTLIEEIPLCIKEEVRKATFLEIFVAFIKRILFI